MQQQQADGSYQELWPKVDGWNKSQVLSDLTRELLGLESTSIPDDAFIALTIGKDSKAYRVKVTYPNGQPAVGFTVGGLTAFPALGLVTNANGMVMGSSTSTTPIITVAQKYDDVKAYSGSFTSTRMITDCNIVLSWNEATQKISSSTSFTLSVSPYATKFNYLLVAAGGSAGGRSSFDGGGGGGRYSQRSIDINQGDKISLTIGAGSPPSQSGNSYTGVSGGNSSLSQNNVVKDTVLGGSGGGTSVYQTTPSGRNSYCQWIGGVGRDGNGKGGNGGSSYWYEDNDGDFMSSQPYDTTNGGNGQPGAVVNFGGLSIKTGGGGYGAGRSKLEGYGQYTPDGTAAASDAGLGRSVGTFTAPNDCAGYAGAAWYYISHE